MQFYEIELTSDKNYFEKYRGLLKSRIAFSM